MALKGEEEEFRKELGVEVVVVEEVLVQLEEEEGVVELE